MRGSRLDLEDSPAELGILQIESELRDAITELQRLRASVLRHLKAERPIPTTAANIAEKAEKTGRRLARIYMNSRYLATKLDAA